ncbi:hypothetical protein FHX82_001575 [Amycolatopsis bartoniae]|uniref:Uncharacterized protein n=1 Tax=Amycolatopsis bartoniae TaxID=941986 RepID=A0A8H9ISF3_9PSEU|nr:hypothetical protein [Amycolatopsis bartoniae]MBB2934555.1 hypothetical protein [Amycolatopsis bartoniae]TVT06890.1 hypothetical protein FNH07_18245 [Amycolatopsis bartoniae]GHF46500.1 hypothetical protein GCM10017566_19530 [Amycolatopsis bartoniae]
MRVYLPATIGMLRRLVSDGELQPLGGTGFALTPALRESYVSGDTEELEYAALLDAARASLRLLGDEEKEPPRRVVLSVDVADATPRPDLDAAVVKISGPIGLEDVAAVHVDTEEAEEAVRSAAAVIDAADLGDLDAEFALGEAEDHELAWYAPQELPFLLELL